MTLNLELNPKMEAGPHGESGMVVEDGRFIYCAGTPLPAGFLDDAPKRSRDERSRQAFGKLCWDGFSAAPV